MKGRYVSTRKKASASTAPWGKVQNKWNAHKAVLDKLCHGDNVQMEYLLSYFAASRERLVNAVGDPMVETALLTFDAMRDMLLDIISMDFGAQDTKLVLLGGTWQTHGPPAGLG